jgi:hypothetical protein
MTEWQDMPEWLNKLIADRPRAADVFLKWEDRYRPELSKRGVTPDMLEPISDPDQPTGIGVRPKGKVWAHARIEYDGDDPRILDALDLLIRNIDGLGSAGALR